MILRVGFVRLTCSNSCQEKGALFTNPDRVKHVCWGALRPELSIYDLVCGVTLLAQGWFVSLVSLLTDFEWKGNRHIHTCQGCATWFCIIFPWVLVSNLSHMCMAYPHCYLHMDIWMVYAWRIKEKVHLAASVTLVAGMEKQPLNAQCLEMR